MMKHVGLTEATTQLPALLDEVEKGGEVTITRDGKPVARLVRAVAEPTAEEIEQRREAIRRLRAIAKKHGSNFTIEEIKSWIEDGRH